MNILRTVLRPLYDSPMGDRLRARFGIRTPINMRPVARHSTISDLFPWRVDASWETCFNLVNLPSLIDPETKDDDLISLVLFDSAGRQIGRREFRLAPQEVRRIDLVDLLGAYSGYGAFACFHDSPSLAKLPLYGCYLSERGYVGFRRCGDRLWSYVHGNHHVLSHIRNSADFGHLGVAVPEDWIYRPQVAFRDACAFDLVYTNPTRSRLSLSLRFLDEARTELEQCSFEVPVRGTVVVTHDNRDKAVSFVESWARSSFWRPIIFKYYLSHFDAFHG